MENKYKDSLYKLANRYQLDGIKEFGDLLELVDNETPRKPKLNYSPTKLDRFFGGVERYTCPRCSNVCLKERADFNRNVNNYCYCCGQKLDWSKEE